MKKLTLSVLLLFVSWGTMAQTYPFASLTGSPQMDTRGWNLIGDAHIGDTNGDADEFSNEMILCNPSPFNRGACFYKQPVNVSECQKWGVEFDYRIFDGNGADGIAFCFLNNPPGAFTVGGNIGIPARPQGLMVILDTYLNCKQLPSERVPKLEIRYADGNMTYGDNTENILECPSQPQPTSTKFDILRESVYNRMKITYDHGEVRVYINDVVLLHGQYAINFPGYFGFTASTGGFNDRHSIRNVTLYTFKPLGSPPDAGLDKTVCSGDEVQIGVPPLPDDPYIYAWYPTTGLDNPTISNPKVKYFNDSANPITYTYFVTKDSLVNDTLCAYSDDVQITVLGKIAQAGPDLTLCSGEAVFINALERDGYRYAWSPATGLSNPDTARTFIKLENHTNAPVTYQYILSVTPLASASGCIVYDTLLVTVQPYGTEGGSEITLCSGDTVRLGSTPVPGFNYIWSPVTGLDDAATANPVLKLTNTTATPKVFRYVLHAWNTAYVCELWDTVTVTVLPKPIISGPHPVCPNMTGAVYRITDAQPGVDYQWAVQGGLVKSGQGSDRITVDWDSTNAIASVAVIPSNAPDCPYSIRIIVNKVLKPEIPVSVLHLDTLCLAQARGIRYETMNTSGSIYTWGVSGNAVIVTGQGTHTVTVDWQGTGEGKVWVSERSVTRTGGCEGTSDTLRVWIEPAPGPEDVVIKSVSTQLDQEKNILLQFRVKPTANLSNTLTIGRRTLLPDAGDWSTVVSVSRNDSLYTDLNLATDEQAYEYRLEGSDNCNVQILLVPHHSILLNGAGDEPNKTVQLNWNEYTGWPTGVEQYEIWRKVDKEPSYTLYETLGKVQLEWTAANAKDGFMHCYRIKVVEEGGLGGFSWSNEVCLEFENPLFIPNVITPNGDGFNDAWVILNLELYGDHDLTIVNRYGKTVLKTSAYGQDWSGEGLTPGLYYYLLTTARNNQSFRGWVQVLR